MNRATLLLCAALLLLAHAALADAAFQLAVPGVNVPDDPGVNGMRLSFFHGKNQRMSGFDLGVLSMSETSHLSGVAFVAGVSRVTGGFSNGAAFSVLNFHSGKDEGVNGAFINVLRDADGFNLGFITVAQGSTGVDLGGVNVSRRSNVQIGFVNVTDRIESFQFGFLNAAENGFLPIFPIFNFPK